MHTPKCVLGCASIIISQKSRSSLTWILAFPPVSISYFTLTVIFLVSPVTLTT